MAEKPRLLIVDDGSTCAKVVRERMPEVEIVHHSITPSVRTTWINMKSLKNPVA